MQTPEEFAWEVLASDDFVLTPHEVLTDLIRARDAEVRADERAKVLAEHGVTVEHRVRRGVHSVRLVSPWEPTP